MNWTDDLLGEVKALYAADVGSTEIARRTGLTRNQIQSKLRTLGLLHQGPREGFWTRERVELLTAHWSGDLPVAAIAAEFGVGVGAIRAKVRRLGLPTRRKRRLAPAGNASRPRVRRASQQVRVSEPAIGRMKPVTGRIVGWCSGYIRRGVRVAYLAELFNVDAEDLAAALVLERPTFRERVAA